MGLPQPAFEEPAPDSGELLSFEAIYDRYADFVWRSLRRLGLDETAAEDGLQDVFLVVHRRLDDFEGRSSIKTWLFGIAIGIVRNHRRTQRRKGTDQVVEDALERIVAEGEPPDEQAERARAVRLLYTLLDALDDDKRVVFVMAELEQMRGPEIAAATGINLNTVYSRLNAAKADFERAVTRWRHRTERAPRSNP
jgi:RNA polymerase sigma-70 factor (ECF subfamily)